MSRQTLFSAVQSPSRRPRRKQQRPRHYPNIWLEWLRSYLKKLKRHRTQTLNQPTIPINTIVRSTATQSKRSTTQRINARQQLWARLRQQPLLDDGGLRLAGGPPFISQQGVTQLASTQWIARPLMPIEPAKSSSLLGCYPLPLSLMLPIVTHGSVSRRGHLPSISLLGRSLSVKIATIDWALPIWQSLKPAPSLPIRPMTEIERVPLAWVASHQTVSPPPSAEKINSSSSKMSPTPQFICRKWPRARIDSAYSLSNLSNHPIKRRKLGRAPDAFAEITRGPTLGSQINEPVATAESVEAADGTDILLMSQKEFLFWKQYYKPLILDLAEDPAFRDSEFMEILQSADPTADINQLLQWVAAVVEGYPEHRAKQAQVTHSLGGTQPAIAQRMAILCLKENGILNEC